MKKTVEKVEVNNSGGVGVVGLLGVLFIALKLTGVIDWSWWWVTIPFWGGLALILAGAAVAGIVAIIVALFSRK